MGHRISRVVVAIAAAATLCVTGLVPSSPASADGTRGSIADVRAQLSQLEADQADLASQNSALQAKLDLAQSQLDATRQQIETQQASIDALRPQIAQIALQEYQNRGMGSTAAFLASNSIDEMMNQLMMSQQVESTTDSLLKTLQLGQASLADLQTSEATTVASIEADKATLAQNIADNDAKVAQTQKLLKQLIIYAQSAAQQNYSAAPKSGTPSSGGEAQVVNPSLGLINPMPGGLVTRSFGQGGHTGEDLAKPCGTNVLSPANGTVIGYYWDGQLGNRLDVNNGVINGHQVMTSYAHLSGTLVNSGDNVGQGQSIALVGRTGIATGCHLHFMLYIDGQLTNPAPYI